jgi:hypothetical protein
MPSSGMLSLMALVEPTLLRNVVPQSYYYVHNISTQRAWVASYD